MEIARVTQLPRPFTLVRLLPGTPHRGIGNGADSDRVMLCVTVDERPHAIEGAVYFSSREYEPVSGG